jgi:hypothetical protein
MRCNVDTFFFDNSIPDEDESMSPQQSTGPRVSPQQWVNIHPTHRERLDVDQTYNVEVTVAFNHHLLARLNKEKKLTDFLILRCMNGNDLFATVSCVYKPTIIGFSLRALSTLNESDVSFEKCDQSELVDSVENKISVFEKNAEKLFKSKLKDISAVHQKAAAIRMMGEFNFLNNLRLSNSFLADFLKNKF